MAWRRGEGDVPTDDGGSLEQTLLLRRQPVDAGGQHGLHRGRHLNARESLRQAIRPALADQGLGLGQGPDALLQKEGVPLGPLDQALLERLEAGVAPEEGLEQFLGTGRWQGVEPELGVVGLVPPAVLVVGAVVDEEEDPRGGEALDQAVEDGLRLGVDPVEVLHDHQQGLDLALPQQQTLDGVQHALAALGRIQGLPLRVLDRHVQEREEGRQGRPQRLIQREELVGDLLVHPSPIIGALNLEVGFEEVDDGQVGGRLPVGRHGPRLKDEPAFRVRRLGELIEEPGLAHARLPDDRHDLAMARAGPLQGLAEGLDLVLPPHKGGEDAGRAACRRVRVGSAPMSS